MSLLSASILFADIRVGETFPPFKLVDQFDKTVKIERRGVTTLLLSFQKGVSSEINRYIESKAKTFLKEHNILYISDVSNIPSLILSWFAIPKMQKFDFKIALIYDKELSKIVPREEDRVTVVTLLDNNVTSIKFVEPKVLDTLFFLP